MILENETGFDVLHPFCRGDLFDNKLPKVVGVASRDVDEEVVAASHDVERDHFLSVHHVTLQGFEGLLIVILEARRDHRLEAYPQSLRVDDGVKARQHAFFLQPLDSPEAG